MEILHVWEISLNIYYDWYYYEIYEKQGFEDWLHVKVIFSIVIRLFIDILFGLTKFISKKFSYLLKFLYCYRFEI